MASILPVKRICLVLGFLTLLSGCAPVDRIVLLPNADGSPSAVVVKTLSGARVLDHPYHAVGVSGSGRFSTRNETPESVNARYAEALAAQPPRAVSYLIYFETGKDEISVESQQAVAQIKADLLRRSAPDMVIVGHTDRVGSLEANDALSLQRAGVVRDILLADGLSVVHIDVAGRGEREPLVVTDDEVSEARNRRVEIIVR